MGLSKEIIVSDKVASRRYLLREGKLTPPLSLSGFIKKSSHFLHDLIAPRGTGEDESVASFFSRRFSPQIVEEFIDPLVKGIYAGDPARLSIQMCFPSLFEKERVHRSLALGFLKDKIFKKKEKSPFTGLVTLKGGLADLIHALEKQIQPSLHLNTSIEKIVRVQTGWKVEHGGRGEFFDEVVSTLPAIELARLTQGSRLSDLLFLIPFGSVTVVHLGYLEDVLDVKGFGYLVPRQEKEAILGTIFDSSVFPQQNASPQMTRLTVMLEGINRTKEYAIEIARDGVRRHLGIKALPDVAHVHFAKNAIPHYPVGFLALKKKIEAEAAALGGLHLLGTSFHGVSVNQAIGAAWKLGEEFLDIGRENLVYQG